MSKVEKTSERPLPKRVDGYTDQFGERFSSVIVRIGSLVEAGKLAGVTDEQIARWRDGLSKPNIFGISRLAEAAGVNLSWLALGEGPEAKSEVADHSIAQPQSQALAPQKIDEQAVLARLQRIEAEFYEAAGPLPFTGALAERRGELVEIATDNEMPESARTLADRLLQAGFQDKEARRRMDERWERRAARQRLIRSKIDAIAAREFSGTVSPNFINHVTQLALTYPLSEIDVQLLLTGAHLLTFEALGKLDLGWKPNLDDSSPQGYV